MGAYADWGKRTVDVAAASVSLLVLSPVLAVVSAAIRAEDRGPALFLQTRVGRDGEPFVIYKFRTMAVDTQDVPSGEIGNPNITTIGRFLRRTNIDELPQLINVLRGDMSLVGPRPPLAQQSDVIVARRANGALTLRPGLSGLAQVNAYDGMSPMEKAVHDGAYTAQLSLLTDLKVVARTFVYLLRPPPTY